VRQHTQVIDASCNCVSPDNSFVRGRLSDSTNITSYMAEGCLIHCKRVKFSFANVHERQVSHVRYRYGIREVLPPIQRHMNLRPCRLEVMDRRSPRLQRCLPSSLYQTALYQRTHGIVSRRRTPHRRPHIDFS
jgi:hypothetical protein